MIASLFAVFPAHAGAHPRRRGLDRRVWLPPVMLLALLTPVARGQSTYATPYTVTTLAGTAGNQGLADGIGGAASFANPQGVAVDSAGTVYVADPNGQIIRKITAGGVTDTLAGSRSTPGSSDGTGTAASFRNPYGIAVDGSGNLYVADFDNHTIRKITSTGIVTTLAGSPGTPGSADGVGSAARFNNPVGIAVTSAGVVYVADTFNHTIRRIATDGTVTTLAGTAGTSGFTNGTGTGAQFARPQGVAVDASGNVYVADTFNSVIRKITTGGAVSTLAGTGAVGLVDGPALSALFDLPHGIALDGALNLYVTDYSTQSIRKVSNTGAVTTLAGSATLGSTNGTGSSASFNGPSGLAVDTAGNLYVADSSNCTIRWAALSAPTLSSATTASGSLQTSLTYTATFSGAMSGPYTATGLPGGLSFNTATGVINGVPTGSGTFSVVLGATNGAGSGGGTLTLTIAKAAQTITFGPLANKNYGDAAFTVSATASSGLTPSFSIASGAATVSGTTVTLTGTGTVVVRASQAGDGTYAAATPVDQSFTVASNFLYWQQTKFTASELLNAAVSGPAAVYGQDGLSNLVKYGLGLEPKQNVTTGLPELTTTASDWVFSYSRPTSITDVTYAVEFSADLISWTTTGVTHELVSTSGSTSTWRGRYPLSSASRAFFRLKVTQP